MEPQSYSNHRKFYYPHHFIFYPVVLLLLAIALNKYSDLDNRLTYILIAAAFFLIGWLSFMMRQHYALSNQNRIIRLEMRLRYYQLTNQRFESFEQKLTFGQIAALRFASDDELITLIERSVNENLSPGSIKKSIKNWQPDYMRV